MACGGSPLVDSTKRNVSRRNTTKALQKDFRRTEEISDQKGRKSLPSYRWQKLVIGKNCLRISSPPNHNLQKKTLASALPCSSRPYAAAGKIAITRRRTPTKLTGDPNLPLHNTPSEAICVICINFHEMSTPPHRSELIDFSIVIVASSSIGAGDDHETDAGWFGGRTDSNCFFVTRKKSNAAPFKQ